MHRGGTTKLGPAISKTGRNSLETWPTQRFHGPDWESVDIDNSRRARLIYPVSTGPEDRPWAFVKANDPAWWEKNQHIVERIRAGEPYTAADLAQIDLSPNSSASPLHPLEENILATASLLNLLQGRLCTVTGHQLSLEARQALADLGAEGVLLSAAGELDRALFIVRRCHELGVELPEPTPLTSHATALERGG